MRLPLAVAPTAQPGPASSPRRRAGRPPARSWSSTTTATPPRAWRCCSSLHRRTRCASPTTALEALEALAEHSSPTSCCSTSACRAWTATRLARRIRHASAGRDVVARRAHRLGPGRGQAPRARGRLRPPPHQTRGPRDARAGDHPHPLSRRLRQTPSSVRTFPDSTGTPRHLRCTHGGTVEHRRGQRMAATMWIRLGLSGAEIGMGSIANVSTSGGFSRDQGPTTGQCPHHRRTRLLGRGRPVKG